MVEGGPQVVAVGAQPGDDGALAGPEPGPLAGVGAPLHPVALAVAGGALLAGAGPQPFQAIGAQGVQEPVAHPVGSALAAQHGLVDESGDGLQDVPGGVPSPSPPTASAVSRSKDPASTDSRAHTVCSRAVHRSWLQSTAARRVRCRGGTAGLPADSSR